MIIHFVPKMDEEEEVANRPPPLFTPNIVISQDHSHDSDDDRPITPPPQHLQVAQRYRRSSLVRMDAVGLGGLGSVTTNGDNTKLAESVSSITSETDPLVKTTTLNLDHLKQMRSTLSFSAVEGGAVSPDLESSGRSNTLTIPGEDIYERRQKGSAKSPKKKRPSLRRLLTLSPNVGRRRDSDESIEDKFRRKSIRKKAKVKVEHAESTGSVDEASKFNILFFFLI